ncbi:tRNA (adenosine(37)-N6)-dimethylallyltransferase MiaA [Undibacterium sp. 5I1]|uniref:tRNA (adenosine(37)-N6)-dimethylallyltransferase MiaA n=1 Tax=unclassified Undibacterium TaxID=2630295 RepID=UPI002AB59E93|nr:MULTISPECIES: tRNA (adenosine(37)-N6)-dimethylallyltransferase MiaA [unclassified Undibacterium]MDY7538992.1 tRNA (adenosine(37)-N6)-dimethylallyltransferase MiaA [Undibacterium sp. 5I1]MEB0232672.1 tRNA (adenosine(37)-N6)-dimethylallyltransferase MiaA [Undibacterium sp. 10I3]MEB0258652.1 tRNA (adenosine(37)-N6)-dimethylallyltransferase MiaA [Undibacterium sp. 5I1]
MNSRPKVIAIMGPTASGKTAAALEIARHIPSEIISVDSALVFREMDIGTAKPSAAELASAPHHLINIIDPSEAYSVAQFLTDTKRLVEDIHARGKLPLLVGGTMMYFKALVNGLDDLPAANPAIRAELDAEAARDGTPALHTRLAALDPITAARLKPNDTQRIQRALEIIALTGQAMSSLLALQPKSEMPFDMLSLSLEPSDRAVLHQRIARRFDIMLEQGFLDEVRTLRQRGDLNPDMTSMRCVGYRQAWEHLDGIIDYPELRERGIIATRQLAKRQLTWLRSIPERIVIDCLGQNPTAAILEQAISYQNS